jgi:uncharacterized membrane protein YkvI
MTFPIAAQLPSAMYAPLVVLVVAYAVLGILGNRARGREDRARAERYSGIAFALVLVAAVWTLVIFLAAAVGYPTRVYDMIIIILVILAFFALLVVAFFVIVEWIPRTLRRGGDR